MVIEMPPLHRLLGAIWVDNACALPLRPANTAIDHAVRPRAAEFRAERLGFFITRRIESHVEQVIETCVNDQNDLSKLRCPTSRLVCSRHEATVMKDCFSQSHLERTACVEHAKRSIAEASWPISTRVRERRHQIAGAWAADASFWGQKVKTPDGQREPRIGLLLGRHEQRPIAWIGDVFEKGDRRKEAANNSYRPGPTNVRELRLGHQPPRSASRYRRTRIKSVKSPSSMTLSADLPLKTVLGARIQSYPRCGSRNIILSAL
jgi:hypothetical protein